MIDGARASIRRRLGGLCALAVVVGVASATPAEASGEVIAGWWASSPLVLAPDVPDGGLLVQAGTGPDEPAAYAAVAFTLAPDERADAVTLAVAPEGGSTPGSALLACQASGVVTPAHGAPAEEGPSFDCADAPVVEADPDQGAYTFDAAPFSQDQAVVVVLLPAGPLDRVVLDAPSAISLSTAGSPPQRPALEGEGGDVAADAAPGPAAPATPPGPRSGDGAAPPAALEQPGRVGPSSEPVSSPPAGPSEPSTGAPALAAAPTPAGGSSGGPAILFAALGVLAFGAWSWAGGVGSAAWGRRPG